jgi:ABC-type Fe3+ transport system permease subunit
MKKVLNVILVLTVLTFVLLVASKILLPQFQMTWYVQTRVEYFGVSRLLTEILKTLVITGFTFVALSMMCSKKKEPQ